MPGRHRSTRLPLVIASLRRLGPRSWVLVLFCALLCAEYGLGRWGGYGTVPGPLPDAHFGWVRRAGRTFTHRTGVAMEINSFGYRDREWVRPAGASSSVSRGGRDGLRVAILGNSRHGATGLPIESSWGRQYAHLCFK